MHFNIILILTTARQAVEIQMAFVPLQKTFSIFPCFFLLVFFFFRTHTVGAREITVKALVAADSRASPAAEMLQ